MDLNKQKNALEWQIGIWDQISGLYLSETERRFVPVVEKIINRAGLKAGERVLDLGTGTGAVAIKAAQQVGSNGYVTGMDISSEMLNLAKERLANAPINHIGFCEGRAESIPAADSNFDVVLASLSLMYVIDRETAAKEIARVLRPGGRLAAAVWAAPEKCDIVLFQQTAGSFAPKPPAPNVGPGALADPGLFLEQLANAGITAEVETEELGFEFDHFDLAWEVLAGVTTANLDPNQREEAKRAVRDLMWPQADQARHFRNVTNFIVGRLKT